MNNSQPVINRVYRAASASIFIYSASSFALPLCLVKISEELGLNHTQGGALGFITSIEVFFVLIASSFAAARFGKIRVLRTSLLILATGLLAFTLTNSFITAAFLMLFIGLGNGFLEALLTPLVEDLYPEDNGSKMNLLHSFWPAGTLFAVLTIGQLLTMGVPWRFLFASLAIIVAAISFWYPSSKKIALPRSRTDFSHIKEILSLPRFWVLGFALFFSGGAEASFAFWSASFIQIHYKTLPVAGAIGTGCFALGMAIGRIASSHLANKIGLKHLILLSTGIGLVASCTFFLITNLLSLYLFLFIMGLTIACLWPSIQSWGGRQLKVDATLLMVFLSCFGMPGISTTTLVMGIIGDAKGLRASFIVAPICMALIVILMSIENKFSKKKS